MGKAQDYYMFTHMMRNHTDRPCFLIDFFKRGYSVEQCVAELESFKRNGVPMFKRVNHGGANQATKHVERTLTVESLQKIALRGALKALEATYRRRMNSTARQWRDEKIAEIREAVRRGGD